MSIKEKTWEEIDVCAISVHNDLWLKRCWASRSVEHDPARAASKTSAIRHDAEVTEHNIHPRHGRILEMNVHNYGKRLFLESLHSKLDKNTVNERSEFPRAYVPLLRTLGGTQQSQMQILDK